MSHFKVVPLSLAAMACVFAAGCSLEASGGDTAEVELGLKQKDFVLSSPSFAAGSALPAEFTCEGKPFAGGTSPELTWTKGPKGTQSYAILLKDLSIEAAAADPDSYPEISDKDPSHAYHWILWGIKGSKKSLPAALPNGQFPEISGLKGTEQLNGAPPWYDVFAYFGPCPNLGTLAFGAPLETHTDAFIIYALGEVEPAVPANATVWQLADYFEATALAKTELVFTSDATPSSCPGFPNPPFACAAP